MSKEKKDQGLPTGTWSRGFAVAKLTWQLGARTAGHALGNLLSTTEEKAERQSNYLKQQMQLMVTELGQLKGSLMKVGQQLSVYGEHFLPPEANAVLKSLQAQSEPLAWPLMEQVLQQAWSAQQREMVHITTEPLASASLGQVYRGRKQDGSQVAIKIQYPNVAKAIDTDLQALRRMLSFSRLLPHSDAYEPLFEQVRQLLYQEVDYVREAQATERFYNYLAHDKRFVVPHVHHDLSTDNVLVTSFEEGLRIDDPIILALPAERRNRLAMAFLELFLQEICHFGEVQTDPHLGNFAIRLDSSAGLDQIVLLDFGAVRQVPANFVRHYKAMVRASLGRDVDGIVAAGQGLGFLRQDDPEALCQFFVDLCLLVTEPFTASEQISPEAADFFTPEGAYLWGKTNLPRRVGKRGLQAMLATKLRPPPPDSVFLDRKVAGVFVLLSVLDASLDARKLVLTYANEPEPPAK